MKVLVADKISGSTVLWLEQQSGLEIVNNPQLQGDELSEAIMKQETEILVVRSTKVNEDNLRKGGKSLKMVIRAGAGYDNIDVKTASDLGILVTTCPGKNSVAVAELIMGHIINIDRKISDNVNELRQNQWNKTKFSKAKGIKGLSIGLIGYGNIGQQMAIRAQSFGMNVIAFDSYTINRCSSIEWVDTIDILLQKSDIVSLSIPGNEDTKGMVNKQFLMKMKSNATLINTSRGTLINESDLEDHLKTNLDFNYGSDVFNNEPSTGKSDFEHRLTSLPNVYGTHHIGASTTQSETEIGQEIERIIQTYHQKGQSLNVVNLQKIKCVQAQITKILGSLDGLIIVQTEINTFMGCGVAMIKLVVQDQPSVQSKMDELTNHVISIHIS